MRRDRYGKPILCPVCFKGRVIDIAHGFDISRLMLFAPHQAHKAQLFSKCPKCGHQIGISVS